ncbi:DJ-1/PfpI family protein [Sphingomonas oryzagri]
MPLFRSINPYPLLIAMSAFVVGCGSAAADGGQAPTQHAASETTSVDEHIATYRPRFERTRPVIAVIGENSGTELTDYVVPYGILRQADVGDVLAIAIDAAPMTMRPALRVQPQASAAQFDARYPDGADYVVVPAVVHQQDPALLAWIKSQAAKGATLVSICDGALVLANSGLMNGHRATAHWATASYRKAHYPQVHWLDDRRYVADGRIVSSAGISAAVPTSLALIEAIAGRARAAAVATEIGASDWSPAHDSRPFHPRPGSNLIAFATTQYLNGLLHRPQQLTIPIGNDVDEVALALTADAYSRTGRAQAYALSSDGGPVETRHGLTVLPDPSTSHAATRTIAMPTGRSGQTLDDVLHGIARAYGAPTAYGVALDLEYPGFHG